MKMRIVSQVKKADAAEFEDSTEATEAYQDIDQLLNDPRLMNWALITDKNYGTRIVAPLKVVIANWKLVFEPMMNAGIDDE